MDASAHHWFGDDIPKAHLHAAIDDSTGTIVGAYFLILKKHYTATTQSLHQSYALMALPQEFKQTIA